VALRNRHLAQETAVNGFREKPHAYKYKGITNDSNYVASCTPTSPLLCDLIFVSQDVHCFLCYDLRGLCSL
jgi:hypothetical protein